MFEKFVVRFVDDFTKVTNMLYSVYNCLLNFEFGCLDINLVGLISFFNFYRTENLIIIIAIIFKAKIVKNILDNKNVVYIIGSEGRKGGKRRSASLFIVIIVIELDDIYFIRFFVRFFFIFIL